MSRICSRNFHSSIKRFEREVFDRNLKKYQREWSLKCHESDYYDYLRREASYQIVSRLEDINRKFPQALDIGCHRGHFLKALVANSTEVETFGVIGGIQKLVQCDSTLAGVEASKQVALKEIGDFPLEVDSIQVDEEHIEASGLDDESFDLVTSDMNLHWVNNIPSALKQIHRVLKPDGAFLGCLVGGATLQELRHCLYLAEMEREGGFSPHVSPLTRPSDIAGLLQGAGFSLPTVDIETVTIGYPNAFVLMEHLQKMGEGNASFVRRFPVGRDTFLAAAAVYESLYPSEEGGGIKATFQMIYMIGWKPHKSQPKPLPRGSAQHSLTDLAKNVNSIKGID